MADYFAGPVMEKIIEKCFEYLKDQIRWQTGMKDELQKLREIHPQIQAVVSSYSQVEIKDPALNKWYWQLRDAVDEADDVLDELEYWKLEKQVNKNKKKSKVRSLMKSLKKRFVQIGKRALKIDPSLKKLEEAVHNLCKISAGVSPFLHLLDRANQEQQQQQLELHRMREAGSFPGNELLGRSREMDFVRVWLRNTENSNTGLYTNVSLLSIVGHGGMGKTTLLQHVFQDGVTEEFGVKMFVCVSNNFDVKTVIKNMLESHKKERVNLDSLGALQSTLQSEVMSKKFLLVLDDIWEEEDGKWENVIAPLHYGSFGSKILITTRLDSVAKNFAKMIKQRKETLPLKGLEEEQCLQLFNTHAFAGVDNPDDEFRSIAGKVVEKLLGCPLAVKVIGGILNSYINKSYWLKVLNTNIGKVEEDQSHLLPILKLSYIYLPNFLQNCFAFCCIFPQDHEFDKDDLVRMWIALGFIESSNILDETLEDKGRRYFNILAQKSFFDEFRNDSGEVYYKMHDLLHELAQFVSSQECFTIVDDRAISIPKTTRHLSINGFSSNIEAAFKKLGELKNLRSLFLSFNDDKYNENALSEILKASKSIRLLVINYFWLEKIPDTIGCLIHLRYLKDANCWNFRLPRSLSHLYHLQFIIAKTLSKLEMHNISWKELMPNENCQLILEFLNIKDPSTTQLTMEPLRSISHFRSLKIRENDKLASFSIETEQWFLKHRSSLFELEFEKLQSLQSFPSSLESLSSLKFLRVNDVPQLKLLPNAPDSLVQLKLCYVESLQCLPSSLSTFSSLKWLHLTKLPLLQSLPELPSSLIALFLEDFKSLQCLPSSLSAISSLETLKLINIPLLESLPDLPSSIEKLKLKELESLQSIPYSLSFISTLKNFKLIGIPLLKSLPDLPSSLIKLRIEELKSLLCLPSSLSAISYLNTLELINIPLKSLPDLPSALEKLKLKELQCLPSSLSTIDSLTTLKLINIPLLKSLPELPSYLEDLKLEKLQFLPSSLSAFSTLRNLKLINISLLKSLPDLPSSLWFLVLEELENLDCLPSSLPPTLYNLRIKKVPRLLQLPDLPSSLQELVIISVPKLLELPNLPASLNLLDIYDCHPNLMKRYPSFYGGTPKSMSP